MTDFSHWEQVKTRDDADLALYMRLLEANARERFEVPLVTREQIGRRLLGMSRECLRRVLVCSYFYRLTGDRVFLQRAEAEMHAAAAFSDWNPSHFLDVAEMTVALAIGYDWLYDDLSAESRRIIRDAIRDKGLKPALQGNHWFWTATNNWNQVCLGGLALGALAIGDDEPKLAEQILQQVRRHHLHGLHAYEPDGVYPEGPSYWNYGSSYSAILVAALRSSLGTDWGICKRPGFLNSAAAYVQTCAPSGVMYNFADGSMSARLRPALFWFAREVDDPGLLYGQHPLIDLEDEFAVRTRFAPLALLWWPKEGIRQRAKLPLHCSGQGHTPIAVFRESWTDPNALYLGLKGGTGQTSHAHLDAGSFVLEADGVRWAIDLQQQGYETIESKGISLWGRSQDAARWRIFRLGPFSHSTLTIDRKLHRVDAAATLERIQNGALVDLSAVFSNEADRVQRGFRWLGNRDVLIRDELEGLRPGAAVRWAMVTRAEVDLNGQRAVLRQDGRELHARANWDFAVIPADPPKDDAISAPNPGTRILIIPAPAAADGTVSFNVHLRAGAPIGESVSQPLKEWR